MIVWYGAALLNAVNACAARAQSDYRNIDGGRPVRLEDATAGARHSLDLQVATLRSERFASGSYRWQLEPRVNYGALPRTELKLRMPFVRRDDGPRPRAGLAGAGFGAFHSVNNESRRLPAFALEGDFFVTAKAASSDGVSYSLRTIATRSVAGVRVHANAGYGTYKVRIPAIGSAGVPTIPDVPCAIAPLPGRNATEAGWIGPSPAFGRCVGLNVSALSHTPQDRSGTRMLAGVAVDRALPLRSLLLIGDVFVERYSGSFQSTDWTGELGVRRQLTPRTVLDTGIGHRFAGRNRAWIATVGLTTSLSARMLIPETR